LWGCQLGAGAVAAGTAAAAAQGALQRPHPYK